MVIDYSDPAQTLPILQKALVNLLSGQMVQTVDIPGPNGSKRVTYQSSNLNALKEEISRCEAAIAQGGKKPRRYAIRAG